MKFLITAILLVGLQLVANEKAPLPYLGVRCIKTPPPLSEHLKLQKEVGFMILGVDPKGPAGTAGLKAHDIIMAVNSQKLLNGVPLGTQLKLFKPGDKVELHYISRGETHTTSLTLATRPKSLAKAKNVERLIFKSRDGETTFALEKLNDSYSFNIYSIKNGSKQLIKTVSAEEIDESLPEAWRNECQKLHKYMMHYLETHKNKNSQ